MIVMIGKLFLTERGRDPQTDITVQKLKRRRHYANNSIFLTVELNVMIYDVWVAAKTLLPQPIAENCDIGRVGFVFIRSEVSTKRRLHTQQGKEIVCHAIGDDFLSLTVADELEVTPIERGDIVKRRLLCCPIYDVSWRNFA